jgi:hypothetical protein
VGTVYLIHFDTKLCHAQHYIGYTNNLEQRTTEHTQSRGEYNKSTYPDGRKRNRDALIRAVNDLGIGWEVVRTWEGDRTLEKKLKRQKKARRLCPVCRQNDKQNKGGNCEESNKEQED